MASVDTGEIRVGRKRVMSYVLATVIQFNDPNIKKVSIKARGAAISRAVDVALITCNRFLKDRVKVSGVKIGSDIVGEPGKERRVSTIEIILERIE